MNLSPIIFLQFGLLSIFLINYVSPTGPAKKLEIIEFKPLNESLLKTNETLLYHVVTGIEESNKVNLEGNIEVIPKVQNEIIHRKNKAVENLSSSSDTFIISGDSEPNPPIEIKQENVTETVNESDRNETSAPTMTGTTTKLNNKTKDSAVYD